MTSETPDLRVEVEELRVRLAEAEETLRAIRDGDADAVVIAGSHGDEVHILGAGDRVYRQFMEAVVHGTATLSADGEIVGCDAGLARILGRPLDRIVGTSMTDHLSTDGRLALRAVLAEADGGSSRLRINLTSAEGRSIPVFLSASLRRGSATEKDLYYVFFEDLEEVFSSEEILRASEERYRQLVTLAPVAIGVLSEGRVVFINPAGARLLGADAEDEVLGKPIEAITHPNSLEEIRSRIRRMVSDEQGLYAAAAVCLKLDGTPIDVEITATPVLFEGSAAVQLIVVDVTERKASMEKTEQLLEERELNLVRLTRALTSTVEIVSVVTETRDPYTAGHQRRVSELAVRISQHMGMSPEQTDEIRIASLLHDIGKMSVPAEILSKPGKLLDIEFDLIKGHSEAGHRIIVAAHMEGPTAEIVYQHHERCDGSGYPRGLGEDDLLLASKVVAVADVVEAMVSHRPYRPGLGVDVALAEIERGAGLQYDADVSAACIRLFRVEGFAFSDV